MKKRIVSTLILVIVVTFFSISYTDTYGRYTSVGTSNNNVNIALPLYEDSISSIIIPLLEMKPGTNQTHSFYVRNQNSNSTISDVTLDYYLSVERSTNLPINIEIIRDGETNNILNQNLISPIYTMSYEIGSIHNYTLTVEWPSAADDYEYSDLVEYLTIKSHAEQKVG